MKCFLVIALVCCLSSQSIFAAPTPVQQDGLNPVMVTVLTCTIGKVCKPAPTAVLVVIGNAVADGLQKYDEKKSTEDGFKEAGASIIKSFSSAFSGMNSLVKSGAVIATESSQGKPIRTAIVEKATEGIEYVTHEFSKNPQGEFLNKAILGGNIGLTLSIGPVSAFVASVIATAAVDGSAHYQKTHNLKQATQIAAESAYNNVVYFMNVAYSLVKSGNNLVKDIKAGKNAKESAKIRGSEFLNTIR